MLLLQVACDSVGTGSSGLEHFARHLLIASQCFPVRGLAPPWGPIIPPARLCGLQRLHGGHEHGTYHGETSGGHVSAKAQLARPQQHLKNLEPETLNLSYAKS